MRECHLYRFRDRASSILPALAWAFLLALPTSGCGDSESSSTHYRLARITQGPIRSTVSATGTLQAVVTVDVGTQISGLIAHVDADFNSPVKAGQVIARIDSKPFAAVLSRILPPPLLGGHPSPSRVEAGGRVQGRLDRQQCFRSIQ